MKKIIIGIALVMFIVSFVGCGHKAETNNAYVFTFCEECGETVLIKTPDSYTEDKPLLFKAEKGCPHYSVNKH